MEAFEIKSIKKKIKSYRCFRMIDPRVVYVGSYYFEETVKFKVITEGKVYTCFVHKHNHEKISTLELVS